jgi:hypothetical protein
MSDQRLATVVIGGSHAGLAPGITSGNGICRS